MIWRRRLISWELFTSGSPAWMSSIVNRTKKLAFVWHGPYRISGKVGENAYRIEIPSHPDNIVTVNVNRMKKFKFRWTRPYADEVPEGMGDDDEFEDGPLREADLPPSSFVERRTVGKEDTVLAGTTAPLLEVVVKRRVNRVVEYLTLATNYETFWLPRSVLWPEYRGLIMEYGAAERRKQGLPTLRQSACLIEVSAEVDEDEALMF
jgi:hypothetical protein